MLTVAHLRKSFGRLVAVDDVSFTLERGQLVGGSAGFGLSATPYAHSGICV